MREVKLIELSLHEIPFLVNCPRDGLVHWRIYALLGFNVLSNFMNHNFILYLYMISTYKHIVFYELRSITFSSNPTRYKHIQSSAVVTLSTYHDITYDTAITVTENDSDIRITTNPYISPSRASYGVSIVRKFVYVSHLWCMIFFLQMRYNVCLIEYFTRDWVKLS